MLANVQKTKVEVVKISGKKSDRKRYPKIHKSIYSIIPESLKNKAMFFWV